MSKVKALDLIARYDPCEAGAEWISSFDSMEDAWVACERPDWMLWLLYKARAIKKRTAVHLACQFARLALPFAADKRVVTCINVTEAWLAGKATKGDVREARYAATSAATSTASSAAASAATYAPLSAQHAASAATATYAATVGHAAFAALRAGDAANAVGQRLKLNQECCKRIRGVFPNPPVVVTNRHRGIAAGRL